MLVDTDELNLCKNLIYGLPPVDFTNLENSVKEREEIEKKFEEKRIPDWEYYAKYGNNAEILERDRLILRDLQIIDEEIKKIERKERREIKRILMKLLF